jgi:hypothetical protein
LTFEWKFLFNITLIIRPQGKYGANIRIRPQGKYGANIRICPHISVFAPVFNFRYLRSGFKVQGKMMQKDMHKIKLLPRICPEGEYGYLPRICPEGE